MANTLTATPDPTYAHVTIRSEFTIGATSSPVTALVERSTDGGVTWTAIRGGNVLTLIGPAPLAGNYIGYLVDTEMPLNTAVRYRSTGFLGGVAIATPPTTAGPVTVTSADQYTWLKDPARPWADLRINNDCTQQVLCATPTEPAIVLVADGLGTEGYSGDYTLFPVLNGPKPADVFAYRKAATTSWKVVSQTLTAMNSLETFYAWGGPIFIQLPPVYGWPDRYYQPDRAEVSRLSRDLTQPYRQWDVPLTVVNAPVGAAQGTQTNNWCAVDAIYPTYADLLATGLTWGDVMAGAAVPADLTDGYGFGPYGSGPYGDGG